MQPPKFGMFFGTEPPGEDDMPFNHWICQVKSSMSLYPDQVLHQGLTWSLKGEAFQPCEFFRSPSDGERDTGEVGDAIWPSGQH